LTWIRGNGVAFDPDTWQIYGGGPEVMFGGSMISDNNDTYLWAFVDTGNDERRVRVVRSTDETDSWHYVNFPEARTFGRPGIATTTVAGQRAWIVVWANYDEGNRDETGYLYASVSLNDGSNWSAPHRVNGFYRIHDGVSLATSPGGDCKVTFTWAGESGMWSYGQNKIRTLDCHVTLARQLVQDSVCIQSEHSRMSPDFAWHQGTGQFVQGIREQDFNTSLDAMQLEPDGCPSDYLHIGGSTTHVAPGLGENTVWNEVVMWFARE
jgi:hypothetical protein